MIKFIKNLLGFGAKETVQEIVTPTAPYKVEPPVETAKPVVKTNKLKAISTPVPASNKPKAKPAVTEGNTKGGNNVVKLQPKQGNRPKGPGKPKAKRK